MVARSVREIGMLLSHNVPILQALEVAQVTAQNRRMHSALKSWRELVKEGGDFTAPLVGLGFEPPPLRARIEVPNDPGSLPNRLLHLADCLDERAQEALDNWLFWAVPVCLTMLITIGLLLGFAP
jgi:type II secretory pathway component PulF